MEMVTDGGRYLNDESEIKLKASIENAKSELEYRTRYIGLDPDRIHHFGDGHYTWVISNPIIRKEQLPSGEWVGVRNLTGWYKSPIGGKMECGIMPIVLPYLIIKLDENGNVVQDSESYHDAIEQLYLQGWNNGITRTLHSCISDTTHRTTRG